MTKVQKTAVAGTFAALLVVFICETLLTSRLGGLQRRQSLLSRRIALATSERDDALKKLAALRDENERLARETPELLKLRSEWAKSHIEHDPGTLGARAWFERARMIKQLLGQWPKKIPELVLLAEKEYLDEAAKTELDTDAVQRRAMSDLRFTAKAAFGSAVSRAAGQFASANNGQFPTDPSQLAPYLQPPMDSFLENYEIAKPGSVWLGNQPSWALVEKGAFSSSGTAIFDGSNHADPEYDMYMTIYPTGPAFYGGSGRVVTP